MPSIAAPTGRVRVEIADVLRGFAVMGITLIHFVERFSLYSYPEQTCGFLRFTDRLIWDGVYFSFSGKAYCIFALLFGFSFFIQDNSQRVKGKDFRWRFAWRMALLLVIACVNSTLFPGEILVLYALLGWVLIAVCRLSTRAVAVIAVILLLQPLEWWRIIQALVDSGYAPNAEFDVPYWDIVGVAQREGSFLDISKAAIWTGNVANMGWMFLHGRLTQTAGLFMAGMLIGRGKLFAEEKVGMWTKAFVICTLAFFPLNGLAGVLPDFISRQALLTPLVLLIKSISNLAFTGILFAGVIVLYYRTRLRGALHSLAPYGRMSLTNYLSQSLVGGALFYNWGLGLYRHVGITGSLLIGICVFLLQFAFCRRWLRSHTQGPLERLWKKATWVGAK